MTAPATIVFDLDGTLIDTAPDLAATMNVLLHRRGRRSLALGDVRNMVGHGAVALMRAGLEATGEPAREDEIPDLLAEFIEYYGNNIANESEIFPGVLAALDQLEAEGFILALCTNKREDLARSLLSFLKLDTRFKSILGGDTLEVCKPDPLHITETIVQAGGVVDRAIHVGDSNTDVAAAKAASVPVIGVSFGYTKVPMAELSPTSIIDHFDELHPAISKILA